MFQNAFKRRKDKPQEPSNGGVDVTPSTTPKPEEEVRLTPPEAPAGNAVQSQPQPPEDEPEEVETTSDVRNLVQDSREVYTPFESNDEALKLNIDRQSEPSEGVTENSPAEEEDQTVHSSETTVVDLNDAASSNVPLDVFDTSSREVRKSDLWALAAELEAVKKEKAESEEKIRGVMGQLANVDEREEKLKDEVRRCVERIEHLEVLLRMEQEKVVKAEEDGTSRVALLNEEISKYKIRGQEMERELKEEKVVCDRLRAESQKEVERWMEKLALSEQKGRELEQEGRLHFAQVEALEETLKKERRQAQENDKAYKFQLANATTQMEEWGSLLQSESETVRKLQGELSVAREMNNDWAKKFDEATKERVRGERKVQELELKATQLAEQCAQKEVEKKTLLEGVLKPLQTSFSDLRSSIDKLRLNNEELTKRLERQAKVEVERLDAEQKRWKRQGAVAALTLGVMIVVLALPYKQGFRGGLGGSTAINGPLLWLA